MHQHPPPAHADLAKSTRPSALRQAGVLALAVGVGLPVALEIVGADAPSNTWGWEGSCLTDRAQGCAERPGQGESTHPFPMGGAAAWD